MSYNHFIGTIILVVFSYYIKNGEIKNTKNEILTVDTSIWVTATAYNALESQTKKGNVGIGAWGDLLTDDLKAIAVSKDLIEMGLIRNREVKIEGLEGIYRVMDKMNNRWTRKIDIFMGTDREAAIQWGKRKVKITFSVSE
jgi:3D (Asp-Asp-Asp) domain-containing protein